MNIGYAVRFCRQQKRMNLPTLAALTKLSPSYLSLLERDKRRPSIEVLERICRELKVPMSVLVFLGSDPAEMFGLSEDVRQKLSDAVLRLLRLEGDSKKRQAAV